MPYGTDSYEKTYAAIRVWKGYTSKRKGYRALKLRAPIQVNCGSLIKLTNETKSSYFIEIMRNSCDLNLGVDFPRLLTLGLAAY